MIRTIITPNEATISFDIPRQYVGKEIEVIAFAKDEGLNNGEMNSKKKTFTVLHVDAKDYKFNRDEANER